jgi:hypothetical protein
VNQINVRITGGSNHINKSNIIIYELASQAHSHFITYYEKIMVVHDSMISTHVKITADQ